jgi:hypothetical protein
MTLAVRSGGPAPDVPVAADVAEFGKLLRASVPDPANWDGLTARVQKVPVPTAYAAERQNFGELVEMAAGLARLSAQNVRR